MQFKTTVLKVALPDIIGADPSGHTNKNDIVAPW